MQDNLIKYLLLLCFAYVYVRLVIPYIGFFARYMFNEPTQWDKYMPEARAVFGGIKQVLAETHDKQKIADISEKLAIAGIDITKIIENLTIRDWKKM